MCLPLIPLALAVAGAGATYMGQRKSNQAAEASVAAGAAQQDMLQRQQMDMIGQQDAAREDARRVFRESVLPTISREKVAASEADQASRLASIFTEASIGAASNADPSRPADSVSTIAPSTNTAGNAAFDAAMAQNLSRAIGFNTQQGSARANIDGRAAAAQEQQRLLGLSAEGIDQQHDIINGIGRNVDNVGSLMGSARAASQAAVDAASNKGNNLKTLGSLISASGMLFGPISALDGGMSAAGAAGSSAASAAASPRLYSSAGTRIT